MGSRRASSKSPLASEPLTSHRGRGRANVGQRILNGLLVVSVATLTAVGCSSQVGASPSASAPLVSPTASPTLNPTASPAMSPSSAPDDPSPTPIPVSPSPTVAPTASPHPTSAIASAPPISVPPPIPRLSASADSGIRGERGTWCLGNECADIIPSPIEQLPTVRLGASGDTLRVTVPVDVYFVFWRASYTDGEGEPYPPTVLGEGGQRIDPSDPAPGPVIFLNGASFEGPPSGSWILDLQLSFAEPIGDAHYKWALVVDQ